MKITAIPWSWYWVFRGLALLVLSTSAVAAPFFVECSAALESRGFERMQVFYARNKDEPRPDYCFRLNRSEFLVTVTNAARSSQGLYYYDATEDSFGLVDGKSRPNLAVEREFMGGGQKRYVLLKSSNLQGGTWEYGYEVLFLAVGKKRQSFVLQELLAVTEDPESGMCGSRLTQSASRMAAPHVSGEGGANLRLEFVVEQEDCRTRTRRKTARAFQPREGGFAEIR
ncbi:MAG: hypothetical protein RIQ60_1283 [Pseudomonadota bacterium]